MVSSHDYHWAEKLSPRFTGELERGQPFMQLAGMPSADIFPSWFFFKSKLLLMFIRKIIKALACLFVIYAI